MPEPRKVVAGLPDAALPGADWADAFEIDLAGTEVTAMQATQLTLGRLPSWARRLLALRNGLARIVGLKTGPDLASRNRKIGMFPILAETQDRVVLGLDDWHLDFRIIVEIERHSGHAKLRATTLVRRKTTFGRLYIGLVGPFHRRIVPATLKGAVAPVVT